MKYVNKSPHCESFERGFVLFVSASLHTGQRVCRLLRPAASVHPGQRSLPTGRTKKKKCSIFSSTLHLLWLKVDRCSCPPCTPPSPLTQLEQFNMIETAVSSDSLYNQTSTLNYSQALMMDLTGGHCNLPDSQQLGYSNHGNIPNIILTGAGARCSSRAARLVLKSLARRVAEWRSCVFTRACVSRCGSFFCDTASAEAKRHEMPRRGVIHRRAIIIRHIILFSIFDGQL